MIKLFTAALAALSIATPSVAGVFEDHKVLWNTLQRVGVQTYINNPDMCDGDNDGSYYPSMGYLVICQDKATSRQETTWTANDLDTLRHEAFHVLQDCQDGFEDNNTLAPYTSSPSHLADMLAGSSYTLPQIKAIAGSYEEQGASKHVVLLELEAFAAADSLSATHIASLIKQQCTY